MRLAGLAEALYQRCLGHKLLSWLMNVPVGRGVLTSPHAAACQKTSCAIAVTFDPDTKIIRTNTIIIIFEFMSFDNF